VSADGTETFSPSSLDATRDAPADPPPKVIRFIVWWFDLLFVIGLWWRFLFIFLETAHAAFILCAAGGPIPFSPAALDTFSAFGYGRANIAAGAELFVLGGRTRFRIVDTLCGPLPEDLHQNA